MVAQSKFGSRRAFVLVAFMLVSLSGLVRPVQAQKTAVEEIQEKQSYLAYKQPKVGRPYYYADGDPLKARIYVLKNGMTVYLSVNKDEPRINTMIGTRAGSKNDPADATGLAHYLEHLLFKGTDKYGSLDYAKEKPLLDEIEARYETYRTLRDDAERAKAYHEIDSVSGLAAKFAIANEYDKMLSEMGAKGTNAFTSDEQTCYVNDIPSSQIRKWLMIEGERFRNPVLRLFHTELEAVYEEKNRTLDNDGRQANEALMANLFKNHPYGTQTTIGTVEHLKNPSITKIKNFYNSWYIPNNMAIALAGDFDMDSTIEWIDQTFGGYAKKDIPPFTFHEEPKNSAPIKTEVFGPESEAVSIAFRLPSVSSDDMPALEMMDMLLSNSAAGLIDLDLNQAQKVLRASSGFDAMKDYGMEEFRGNPKAGQSLEEVEGLLLGELNKIKQGNFDTTMMAAVVNDMTIRELRAAESNGGRVRKMMESFILGQDWGTVNHHIEDVAQIRKADVVRVANQYFGNDYVVVYKRNGERRNVAKVVKPPITPVSVNREAKSVFLQNVLSRPAEKTSPKFVDYDKDIKKTLLKNATQIHYVHNDENQLFTLAYTFDIGRRDQKLLPYAMAYQGYLGTDQLSAADLKKKFFALGCDYNFSAGEDQSTITLSGLDKSFEEGLKLLETIIEHSKPDEAALKELIERSIKGKLDAKKNKNVILQTAMRNYAIYGPKNPFTDDLPPDSLRKLESWRLVEYFAMPIRMDHRVLYYGPRSVEDVVKVLNRDHVHTMKIDGPRHRAPFARLDTKKNKVYYLPYPMAQTEIMMLSKGPGYDPKLVPDVRLYNEYFGGSMAGIVFQTLRESKALAYSVNSGFMAPSRSDDPFYNTAYIGSQADKLPEAMAGMMDLLHDMPRADANFAQAKEALKNKIESERITRFGILQSYENAKRLGVDYDLRSDLYKKLPTMTFKTIEDFQKKYVKDDAYAILVIGPKEKVDLKKLGEYGEVEELTLQQVFGY